MESPEFDYDYLGPTDLGKIPDSFEEFFASEQQGHEQAFLRLANEITRLQQLENQLYDDQFHRISVGSTTRTVLILNRFYQQARFWQIIINDDTRTTIGRNIVVTDYTVPADLGCINVQSSTCSTDLAKKKLIVEDDTCPLIIAKLEQIQLIGGKNYKPNTIFTTQAESYIDVLKQREAATALTKVLSGLGTGTHDENYTFLGKRA